MFIETATSWGSAGPRRLQQLCSGCAGYAGKQVAALEQGWPRACSPASEPARWPQSLLTVQPPQLDNHFHAQGRTEMKAEVLSAVSALWGGKPARFYTFMVFKPCFQGEKVMSNASFFNHP